MKFEVLVTWGKLRAFHADPLEVERTIHVLALCWGIIVTWYSLDPDASIKRLPSAEEVP